MKNGWELFHNLCYDVCVIETDRIRPDRSRMRKWYRCLVHHPSIHPFNIYISFYWMLMCSKILNTSSQRTRNTKFLYSFPAVVKQDGFDQLQFHSLSIECSILWYVWMIQRFRLKAGWVRIEKDTADDFMMICQNLKLQNVFWISGDRWKSFFSVRFMSDESAE